MSEDQKVFLKKLFEFRKNGDLTYRDITVIMSLMFDLDFKSFKKIICMKVVNATGIHKSDVSKSVIRMIDLNIIIRDSLGLCRLNLQV